MRGAERVKLVLTCTIWLALAAAPLLLSEWRVGQLAQLICYAIFAMSLAFVWGQAGLLCFGQAIFFGIGGYSMAVVTKGMIPGVAASSLLGLALAALLPALVALVAGVLMFRGRGLSGAYFAIVTLAAAVIVERAASHWDYLGGFNGLLDVPPLKFGMHELIDPLPQYFTVLAIAFVLYLLLLVLERAPLGSLLRAIRDNESRTAYFGLDVFWYKTFALSVSAAVAGVAGALFVPQFSFVSPTLIGVPLSTEVLIWTALGGREVLFASFLGALLVRSAESVLSDALGNYWLLVLGALFVVTVVFFPRGVLGSVLALGAPRRLRTRQRASRATSDSKGVTSDK